MANGFGHRLSGVFRRSAASHDAFVYAESLADKRPVNARVARTVTSTPGLSDESAAVRRSLEYLREVDELEPTVQLTQNILREARRTRAAQRGVPAVRRQAFFAVRMTAYAGGLCCAVLVAFSAALGDPAAASDSNTGRQTVTASAIATVEPADSLERAADEVRVLSRAILSDDIRPASARAYQQLRNVSALDADIAAAVDALRRNPGCERADSIVRANLKRQAELLREIYLNETL